MLKLRDLKVGGNQFTEVPAVVGEMTKLVTLELSKN